MVCMCNRANNHSLRLRLHQHMVQHSLRLRLHQHHLQPPPRRPTVLLAGQTARESCQSSRRAARRQSCYQGRHQSDKEIINQENSRKIVTFDNRYMYSMSSSGESEFLGESQTNVLRVLRTFSALLSVLGSSLIIAHVILYKRQKVNWNSKHRLLAGLSIADLIFSAENVIFTPFVYPITSPSPVCSFDAFIHSVGNAAAYYNAALSFYFLAVIRYNIKDEQFAARYEPFCHLLPVSVALTAATTGLFLEIYNPKASGLGCWVEDYPRGCSDLDSNNADPDTLGECRGDGIVLKLFPSIATVLPFVLALLTMIVSNVLIYRFVRRLERRNARYSITASAVAAAQSSTTDPSESRQPTRRSSFAAFARRSITLDASANTEQTRRTSTSTTSSPDSMQRSKRIASQSFCYIGAFFACYLPGVIFWIAGFIYPAGQTNGTFFFLQVINALFFPAQGFFNMIVYLRPQYLAWRTVSPGNGVLYSWRMAATLQTPSPPKIRQRRPSPPALQSDNNDGTTANNTNTSGEDEEKARLEGLDEALSGAFLSEANDNPSQALFSDTELSSDTHEKGVEEFHDDTNRSPSDTSVDVCFGPALDMECNDAKEP